MAPPPLSPGAFAAAVSAISDAFGDPTRRAIYLFAQEQPEGVTTAQVAERFGLHANVARHHLEKLAAAGHLDVATERASSGAGRPSKRYRTSMEQVRLEVPVRTDDLVFELLGRALGMLTPEQAEQMAEEVGAEYGRTMARSVAGEAGQRSFRSALHAVADALTAHGFAAHAERKGTRLEIINDHCPFGATAVQHPVICAVDRGMVKGMLGALVDDAPEPVLAASRSHGDQTCVTTF